MKRIERVTADGTLTATVFQGAGTGGVILYMDAFGPRAALDEMATRITGWGYSVLVPDLFYRAGSYGPFDVPTAFDNPVTRAELMGMIAATTQDMTVRDGAVFLDMLAAEGVTGPVGTVGYCLGGGRALNAAAAYPDRIKAAASFHGGNLASDVPDSPHTRVGSISGRVYVGSAGVDRSFPPEQSARLAQALREARVDHQIENYVGMQHGWCVSDHSVYDAKGAARHWRRLETFFAEGLAG
ncbi:MAG: dienelactone hydrolase family protein [Paracoccaceae bacterium]